MARTIESIVFTFGELSDRAKERAREWWRGSEEQEFSADLLQDDFETVAGILGIEFKRRDVRLMSGRKCSEPCILWTGFSSQGDGACFEGSYSYTRGSRAAIRKHAPLDSELHAIADGLADVQRRYLYGIEATVRHSGRYYHEFCTDITVERRGDPIAADDEERVKDLLRGFMRWIYRQLEAEYDHVMSDESVDESIVANGYEFTESGKPA